MLKKIKINRENVKWHIYNGDNYEALDLIQKSVLLIDNLISKVDGCNKIRVLDNLRASFIIDQKEIKQNMNIRISNIV